MLNDAQIDTELAKASEAQKAWATVPLEDRISTVERFMTEFEKNTEQTALDISGQMGKPLKYAKGECVGMMERVRAMMDLAPTVLAEEMLPEKPGFCRRIVKEPVGTVLVIAPWNFPLLTTVNSIIPSVLAGNSVVLKHSPRTPLSAQPFADAFAAAGAPDGLVVPVVCSHEAVDRMISAPAIGFTAFTGSVGGGRAVYQSVAKHGFNDVTLELGGKDPAYVAPDADLDAAVETLIDGAFFNSGQSCCGIERIYVHRSLYDAFLERALPIVQGYQLGNPLDESTNMGPMAQATAIPFLHEQVKEAVSMGAKLLCGGEPTADAHGKGRFFAPTLLSECDHRMSLMMEESFGPVLGVKPVDSDEEAVALMNDSPYGLTAVVFTSDQERAEKMAAKVKISTPSTLPSPSSLFPKGRGCCLSLFVHLFWILVSGFWFLVSYGVSHAPPS